MNHLRFSWRNVPRSPFRRFSPSKTNLVFPAALMINEIIRAVRFTSIKHTLRVISSKRSHIQRGGLVCWFKRLSEKIHFLWVWMNEAPASKKTIKCSSSRQIEIKSKQDKPDEPQHHILNPETWSVFGGATEVAAAAVTPRRHHVWTGRDLLPEVWRQKRNRLLRRSRAEAASASWTWRGLVYSSQVSLASFQLSSLSLSLFHQPEVDA